MYITFLLGSTYSAPILNCPFKLAKKLNSYFAQCGTFKIFVSLKFYVKSILRLLEVQNQPLFEIDQKTKFTAPKMAKAVVLHFENPQN